MSLQISIDIEGEKQLNRRLLIISDGVSDFSRPLTAIGSELQKTFQDNFAEEGSLFGGWAKRKDNNPWPILQKTGRMRGSFRTRQSGKDKIILDNPTPYFKYHQSNQTRRKIPRRIMMKIDNQRKLFIVKQFQVYINELIKDK